MPIAMLFGSPADWVVIFIVALVIFGPDKLPELGKQLGKAVRDFRKISDEITGATSSIHQEISNAAGTLRREVQQDRRPPLAPTAKEGPLNVHVHMPGEWRSDPEAAGPEAEQSASTGGGLRLSTSPEPPVRSGLRESDSSAVTDPKGE
jgi:sec-independent protein translocase protein TatA